MKNILVSVMLALFCVSLVSAQIGGTPKDYQAPVSAADVSASVTGGLQPVVTETGKISWSIDALGSNSGSGTIQVEKPAGATVRSAYLMAASTGFTGYQLTGSDVTLAGLPVVWDTEVANGIGSYNYFTDVTSVVKVLVDGSSPGLIDLPVTEASPSLVEGVTLVVIFDDPSKADSTIILAFGAQQTTGDSFHIGLADAVDKSAPGFLLDMSLGISYSYQSGDDQVSLIDINGQRLTSSSGGEDDGESANGALFTTGGIGDSNANPADPNALPGGDPRYDDELYDLTGIVQDGETSIDADTLNPTDDDNIFFAGFFLGATTAVVGEGIVLSPQSATNPVGTEHTVTATVQDDNGAPINGTLVTFEIVAGPHTGQTGSVLTGSDGKASFTWTGVLEGTDEIVASFVSSQQQKVESNHATKTWVSNEVPEFGLLGAATIIMLGMLGIAGFRKRQN